MQRAGRAGRTACWLVAAAAIAASLAAHAEEAFAPIAFSRIDFDPQCRPNAAFAQALETLAGLNRQALAAAAPDTSRYGTVSSEASLRMRLRDRVDWNGLRLLAFEHNLASDESPANYRLTFADPPEQVRAVWHARGWDLPPTGETREVDGPGSGALIRLSSEPDGAAAVTCFRD